MAAAAQTSGLLSPASSVASSRAMHREQAILILKNIITREVDVEQDVDARVALGIKEYDPRKEYEWSVRPSNVLGKGGFGIVYRGQKRTRRGGHASKTLKRTVSGDTVSPTATEPVAIKICYNFDKGSTEQRFKLWREVAVMRMLAKSHRCKQLLPLFDAYMWQSSMYIVMPLCAGGQFDVLKGWSEGDVAGVAVQVARALKHMHEIGCVHHDVKPNNLLLLDTFSPPRVVLADYGESLIIDEHGRGLKAPNATLLFAPPEWMGGYKEYGPATDIFALGVTVCFLLTGMPPFDPNPLLEAYKTDEGAALRMPGTFVALDEESTGFRRIKSEEARDFVRRCCAFEAGKRPSAASLLNHPWVAMHGMGSRADTHVIEWATQVRASLQELRMAAEVGKVVDQGRAPGTRETQGLVSSVSSAVPVPEMRARFHEIVPLDGELGKAEFVDFMTGCGYGSLPLGRLFTVYDKDNSGGVSFPELIEGLGVLGSTDLFTRVGLLFEIYDTDGDGKLCDKDIREALNSVRTEYSSHPAYRASVAELSSVLRGLMDADGFVSREQLTELVISDRKLLRLFLSPAEAAEDAERLKRLQQWQSALLGAWADSIVSNPFRSLYIVAVVVLAVVLVLHLFGVIDIDGTGLLAWNRLDDMMDAPGGVDGSGDTVGDVDYVLHDSRLLDID